MDNNYLSYMIKNLKDVFTKFKDEAACRDFLVKQRWDGVPECPHCGYRRSYIIDGGKKFKCANRECYKKYSVTVGTIFEASNIPLTTWFQAMYHIVNNKKGMSSTQLARHLGVTQKTAWFMTHRIREALKEKNPRLLGDVVQADETFVGGKNKNRHDIKKFKNSSGGRSSEDKTPVLGAMANGYVRLKVAKNTTAAEIAPFIKNNVRRGSILVTDEYGAYRYAYPHCELVMMEHVHKEYVRGPFHTNSIEGFWSFLKRGYIGIYHYMSRKHLQRYCDEFAYRYNTRKLQDGARFLLISGQINGRLTYKQLVHGEISEKEARKTIQAPGQ